jgi:hypothetical protein
MSERSRSTDAEPLSEARRTAVALATAHETVNSAAHAAARHRYRADHRSFPQHIGDLEHLAQAMETMRMLAADLAAIVKSCADDVRARYVRGLTPTGDSWPNTVKQAAADADQTLSTLRRYLEKTPVPAEASYDALAILHGFIRDMRRSEGPEVMLPRPR